MFALKENTKKIARLKKRADFLRVQQAIKDQKGRKWVAKGLIIEMAENESLGVRYGITVSKRVSKLAVTRNRVKRRLKSIISEVLPEYDGLNLDIVVIGRVESEKRDYQDLKNDLIWCLKKMGVEPVLKQ